MELKKKTSPGGGGLTLDERGKGGHRGGDLDSYTKGARRMSGRGTKGKNTQVKGKKRVTAEFGKMGESTTGGFSTGQKRERGRKNTSKQKGPARRENYQRKKGSLFS